MLNPDMRRCQVDITPYHLQSGVAQDLLQGEDVTSIHQVVGGKRMAAEVGM